MQLYFLVNKDTINKKTTSYNEVVKLLVEAEGVEPSSENTFTELSPSEVVYLHSPV